MAQWGGSLCPQSGGTGTGMATGETGHLVVCRERWSRGGHKPTGQEVVAAWIVGETLKVRKEDKDLN